MTSEFDDPKKIMIAGDWHGSANWAVKAISHARKAKCDTIVHVGDFGFYPLSPDGQKYLRYLHSHLQGMKLYWVDGNHEFHDRIASRFSVYPAVVRGPEWADNHPWSDRIIHRARGERWTWHNKVWMGLGGAVSVDKYSREPGKDWFAQETLSLQELEYAAREGKVDVVIAHDVPTGANVPGIHEDERTNTTHAMWPPELIRASWDHRDALAVVCDEVRPEVWYHGHYHRRYTDLRESKDGWKTIVHGLDCDGAQGGPDWSDNWVIMDPAAP